MNLRRGAAALFVALVAPLAGLALAAATALAVPGWDEAGRGAVLIGYAIALAPMAALIGLAVVWLAFGLPRRGGIALGAGGALVGAVAGTAAAVALRGWYLGARGLPPLGMLAAGDDAAMTVGVLPPLLAVGAVLASRARSAARQVAMGLAIGALGGLGAGVLVLASRAVSTAIGIPPLVSAAIVAVAGAGLAGWRRSGG